MNAVLILLTIQGLLGAFDNLWHHEIKERLPTRPSARGEVALHAVRELLYAVVFVGIAWYRWDGAWTFALISILGIEVAITLWDFVIEDQTRRLPRLERITHSLLAINFGAILAFWAPELLAWSARPTALTPVDYGAFSWILTLYGGGVLLWSLRDVMAAWRLSRPDWQRHPIRARSKVAPLRVLVTGGTGFIGRALVRDLVARGDQVTVLSRDPSKVDYLFGRQVGALRDLKDLDSGTRVDAIVNLAGEPLAGGFWTESRKRRFVRSRADLTRDLADLIERLAHKPKVLVSGSAVGYYGPRGDEILTEPSPPEAHFLSRLCRIWELQARRAEAHGVRVCRLRIGFVLGRDGGSFPALALPVRFGLGTVLGDGEQWLSWIHLADLVRLILFAIADQRVAGAVNATSPNPVTHRAFMNALGGALGKPILFRVPAVLLRGLLGDLAGLFLTGQRVLPQAAETLGFRFELKHLSRALENLTSPLPAPAPSESCPIVFYNDDCPVCRIEIEHYATRQRRESGPSRIQSLAFQPITQKPQALAAFGLEPEDIERRLYLLDGDGALKGGIDALIKVWAQTPGYRTWARLVSSPLIHGPATLIYDGLLAPGLVAWNRYRRWRARNAPA